MWTLVGGEGVNGSWSGRYDRVRCLAGFQGRLYAGLGARKAEVWSYDGSRWRNVTGPWLWWSWKRKQDTSWVNALHVHDGYLYAGVGHRKLAQLWRFDGRRWSRVATWPDAILVYALATHDDALHIGLQRGTGTTDTGAVYRLDGTKISRLDIPREGPARVTYTMISHGGALHVALGSEPEPDLVQGEVWRFTGRWERIGGDGVNGSWALPTRHLVTSLAVYRDRLVAGINCQAAESFVNLWSWDGSRWSLFDPVPATDQRSFNALLPVGDTLYTGGGAADRTDAFTAWAWRDGWTRLGEPNGSDQYVYSLARWRGDIYAGSLGGARLFRLT